MMKTLLITVSISLVVGLSGTVLTLFGPNTLTAQYVKFAIMLLLFLVIVVGARTRAVEAPRGVPLGVLGNPEPGGDALPPSPCALACVEGAFSGARVAPVQRL